MSGPTLVNAEPLTETRQLVEYLAAGCKPRARWRIGTEHEKFGYRLDDFSTVPYEGESGIGAMLAGLMRFGWKPVREGRNIIALTMDGQSVTLEPGGQFELSGAPVRTLHETCAEVHNHLNQVKVVAAELGLGFHGLGFRPKSRRDEVHWMPKGRYAIMRRYMPTKGNLGLDMMTRTCTVQVNLDFESEADMVKKFRVGLALQPVATALFANSPFVEGKPSGYLSYRSHVWTDTDPERCGTLPVVFEDGMGFERYVEHVLDVPMYFVYRDSTYIDASGQSFRDFLAGELPALPGERPRMTDWEDHLTTLFPEVRLKQFLEMRGTDGGPWGRLCALPALWVGLFYDAESLDAAWQLVEDWNAEEREVMREEVTKIGLATPFRNATVRELAFEMLTLARAGLARRAIIDGAGRDECHFLDTLDAIAASGRTPAEDLLDAYQGRWKQSVDPLFTEHAY